MFRREKLCLPNRARITRTHTHVASSIPIIHLESCRPCFLSLDNVGVNRCQRQHLTSVRKYVFAAYQVVIRTEISQDGRPYSYHSLIIPVTGQGEFIARTHMKCTIYLKNKRDVRCSSLFISLAQVLEHTTLFPPPDTYVCVRCTVR